MYDFVDLWRSAAQAGMPSLFVAQPHFWSFIRDGMLPMIGPAPSETTDGAGGVTGFTFPSSEGDYGLAQRNLPNVNGSLNRLALNGNVIVDGIWIRQLRVASINCTKFGKLAQVRSAARGKGGGESGCCVLTDIAGPFPLLSALELQK